jgi:response regulator RpfG family c-di-GMP phosphodiesterase
VGYILNSIFLYSRNFKYFLKIENYAFPRLTAGSIDKSIKSINSCESGLMHNYNDNDVRTLVTVYNLRAVNEAKESGLDGHVLRIQRYVNTLATALSDAGHFKDELNPEMVDLLWVAAPLYDIGKIAIPANILLKPGKLNNEEFKMIQTHVSFADEALYNTEKILGSSAFLRLAREIVYTHHEKWDGSGYPQGLKEDSIPLAGRIVALADVYDALISKKVYKPAFSHDKAKSIILAWKGKHFDPNLVDAFIARHNEFAHIAEQFKDQAV